VGVWEDGADRGLKVIIAGAGGAAHLPGMMASKTRVPVIGVPVQTKALSGVDSLYSIVQMPRGYPVATMAIGAAGAANAGLMAAAILATNDPRWPSGSTPGARRCRPPSPMRPAMTEPLPSGSTIGILGGGQLGRMLSVAASRLGYRTHIFEPGAAPAADVSATWTQAAPYDDLDALRAFAGACDVITYEFENIPADALDVLSRTTPLYPDRARWR
jgi:5-(carboxyamino)imidazole ribonucleotide synthase